MNRRMRLASVIGEALCDIATGTTRAFTLGMLLAVLFAAVAGMDLASIVRIERQARDYVAAGGTTSILDYPGHIDGRSCDRLTQIDGVLAAGAISTAPVKLTPAATPSSTIPAYEITPGAQALFRADHGEDDGGGDGEDSGEGMLLSSEAAEPLGVSAGGRLTTANGETVRVLDVYAWPQDGRQSTLGYAALIATHAGRHFDQCWVRTWPTPSNMSDLLRTSIADTGGDDAGTADTGAAGATGTAGGSSGTGDGSGDKPRIIGLNDSLGSELDSTDLYRRRLTAVTPMAMLVLGFAVAATAVRIRRLELASALHDGVPRAALLVQHGIETLAWVIAGIIVASVPIVIAATHGIPACDLPAVLAATLAAAASATLVGAMAGTGLGVCAIRERQLFVYCKDR